MKNSICLIYCRAYDLYEEGIHVNPEREHVERALFEEYKQKLNIEDETIPDPVDLKVGWIGEENGMEQWPRLYVSVISQYYSSILGKTDLINRLECEYKQGKVYRCFSNKFIGEILFHYISDESKFSILKTKGVPSQRVSMKQYDVWVICCKNKGHFAGGQILAGYCTCTAGLLPSCNHVAGSLFRVEAAVLTGYCNPTCASTLATWNITRGKKQIQPDDVSKFLLTHDTYMKKATQETLEKRKIKVEVIIISSNDRKSV